MKNNGRPSNARRAYACEERLVPVSLPAPEVEPDTRVPTIPVSSPESPTVSAQEGLAPQTAPRPARRPGHRRRTSTTPHTARTSPYPSPTVPARFLSCSQASHGRKDPSYDTFRRATAVPRRNGRPIIQLFVPPRRQCRHRPRLTLARSVFKQILGCSDSEGL